MDSEDCRGERPGQLLNIPKRRNCHTVCETHYRLVRDLKEEKALKREQAAERRRWGDPQRVID